LETFVIMCTLIIRPRPPTAVAKRRICLTSHTAKGVLCVCGVGISISWNLKPRHRSLATNSVSGGERNILYSIRRHARDPKVFFVVVYYIHLKQYTEWIRFRELHPATPIYDRPRIVCRRHEQRRYNNMYIL